MGRDLSDLLSKALEGPRLELLHLLAYQAALLRMPLYLVGGVVRDLLLDRRVHDFDLVVEGDSAELAEYVVRKLGGKILIHSRFGTATWIPNASTLNRLSVPVLESESLELAFDLISARTETYEYPGALPTVRRSGIRDDLRRRDFTINAMALRLDQEAFGELFDPLHGEADLTNRLLRVLHDRSFVDDPTRMFRAARYAGRYHFELAPETLQLINEEAAGVLAQLSGERLRHEFDLIFEEADPAAVLERLRTWGLPARIQPALQGGDVTWLAAARAKPAEAFGEFGIPEMLSFRQTLSWVLYLLPLKADDIEAVAQRLAFPTALIRAARAAASLRQNLSGWQRLRPSDWTFRLDEAPALAVYAVWLATGRPELESYLAAWRHVRPYTSGYTLQQSGLPPGPRYKEILMRLRAAWLDGEVQTEQEELRLRQQLLPRKQI